MCQKHWNEREGEKGNENEVIYTWCETLPLCELYYVKDNYNKA